MGSGRKSGSLPVIFNCVRPLAQIRHSIEINQNTSRSTLCRLNIKVQVGGQKNNSIIKSG